jgi:hypothetical protein
MKLKKIGRVLFFALIGIGVVGGGAFGIRFYVQKKKASLEYAIEQLNLGIAAGNVEQLATVVDFASLSADLAADIMAIRPADGSDSGDDARQRCQQAVRQKLEAVLGGKKEGGERGHPMAGGEPPPPGAGPDQALALEDPVFTILKEPTPILPPNLLEQIRSHPPALQVRDENTAILATTVTHDVLNREFVLRLTMQRENTGWRLVGLGNGTQVVGDFMGRINEMKARAVDAFNQENDRQRLLMNTYDHVGSCRSVLFLHGSGGVVQMRVTLEGMNMGDRDLFASGSTCDLFDRKNAKIASLRLENVRTVAAGEHFEHGWFYNFEDGERPPQVDAIIAAGEVHCKATPTTVSLGKGSMLYLHDIKDWPGVKLE